MMQAADIEDLTVSEILRRWPGLVRLFIGRHLLCVGCPIAPFHTLADVAFEHAVDYDELVAAVLDAANTQPLKAAPALARR